MATNTNNYGFKKPEENDFYSNEDQNRNWDLADTKMAQLNSDLTKVVDYASEFEAVMFSDNVTLYTLYSCYKIAKRLRVSALLKLNDNVVGVTTSFTILHLANKSWAVPAKPRIGTVCRYGSTATHMQQMNISTNGLVQLVPRGDLFTSQYIIVDFDIDTTTTG